MNLCHLVHIKQLIKMYHSHSCDLGMITSGTSSATYYSQVDTKVLVGKIQRLDDSGLSDSASARPSVIPTLRLRHLPQLTQHTQQRHTVMTPGTIPFDTISEEKHLRNSQNKQGALCKAPGKTWIKYNILIIKEDWGMIEGKLALQWNRKENEMQQ